MKSFAEIIAKAKSIGPRTLAVAGNLGRELEEALEDAEADGIARAKIYPTALGAVKAVRNGEADIVFKGIVSTRELMSAVLDKDVGFRSGRLMSHVLVHELLGRLIVATDAGICIRPTLDEKVAIIENVLPICRALGIDRPKVALLSAIEKENPRMPDTMDAAEIAAAGVPGCDVQGPLALDLAISPRAAEIKGVTGPVAGCADVLVFPDIVSGNIFGKSVIYFAEAPTGGIVAGASRPVAFLSRSDPASVRYNIIALSVLMSGVS